MSNQILIRTTLIHFSFFFFGVCLALLNFASYFTIQLIFTTIHESHYAF